MPRSPPAASDSRLLWCVYCQYYLCSCKPPCPYNNDIKSGGFHRLPHVIHSDSPLRIETETGTAFSMSACIARCQGKNAAPHNRRFKGQDAQYGIGASAEGIVAW